MKTLINGLLLLGLIFVWSCGSKDGLNPKMAASGDCGSGSVLKKAKNRIGTVSYIPQDSTYLIVYHEPGTYDTVDIGYTCNLPDNMKEPGLKVEFSGEYKKHPLPGAFGGSTNYYLKLTGISRK